MKENDNISKIMEHAEEYEVFRPVEIEGVANPRPQIARLLDKGVLTKMGRGIYTLTDREISHGFSLAVAAKRVPGSVVCLISALQFHEFTTQIGYQSWMAVGDKRPISVPDVPIRIIRMSGASFHEGIEIHTLCETEVRVYNPAKTIADCFKFRHQVGLDVAMEALREGWRERKFSVDELMGFARINRVEKLMTPYVKMTIS